MTREQKLEAALHAILNEMAGGNPTHSPMARADFIRDTCRFALSGGPDAIPAAGLPSRPLRAALLGTDAA
jgi:hypothetical protein